MEKQHHVAYVDAAARMGCRDCNSYLIFRNNMVLVEKERNMKISKTITTDRFQTKDGKTKRNALLLLLKHGWFEKGKRQRRTRGSMKTQKGFELKRSLFLFLCSELAKATIDKNSIKIWIVKVFLQFYENCDGSKFLIFSLRNFLQVQILSILFVSKKELRQAWKFSRLTAFYFVSQLLFHHSSFYFFLLLWHLLYICN